MTGSTPHYFFQTIYNLRAGQEVILYDNVLGITETECADVASFLGGEYDNECLEYPGTPPAFDESAALWGARTVYYAAQLLLYRQPKEEEMRALLPSYTGPITPGALLSADLCLRFLPQLLRHAGEINPDDALIPLLEPLLRTWHYSGIGYGLMPEPDDLEFTAQDSCMRQMYANRIIALRDIALARLPLLSPIIKGSLGDYTAHFWKQLIE